MKIIGKPLNYWRETQTQFIHGRKFMNVEEKKTNLKSDFYIEDQKLRCGNPKIIKAVNEALLKNSFYVIAQIFVKKEGNSFEFWRDGWITFKKYSSIQLNRSVNVVYYVAFKIQGVSTNSFFGLAKHSDIFGENNAILDKKTYDFLNANHRDLSDPNDQFTVGKYLINIVEGEEVAIDYLKNAANMGNINAQDRLGICYYYGYGVALDHQMGFEWFKKSADAGCIKAQYHLFRPYFFGNGTKKNEELALEYCERAAKSGYRKAQFELGSYYHFKDSNTAVHWFMQAALSENGRELIKNYPLSLEAIKSSFDGTEHPSAMVFLGICFQEGKAVEKNEKLAFILFSIAAEKNDLKAVYRLGFCYEDGIGTEIDYKKAFEYYNKCIELECAEKSFLDPLFDLANMYERGLGIEVNQEKALILYTEAAEKGFSVAQNKLGESYKNGELGLGKNLKKAIYWYKKAAKQKLAVSMTSLAELYIEISKEQSQREKKQKLHNEVFRLFKELTGMGLVAGEMGMAKCYMHGIGVSKNLEKYREYIESAAHKENPEAIFFLGELCFESAPKQAIEYYLSAAEKNYSPAMEQLSRIYTKGIPGVLEKDISKGVYWADKAQSCSSCEWEDCKIGNTSFYFNIKNDLSEELKFWLNSVLYLSQKYQCSVNELNVQEIDEYAKELKDLHEKIQKELEQKCQVIQDEYYKNITLNEILSEFNVCKTKVKTPHDSKNKIKKNKSKSKSNTNTNINTIKV